MRVLDALRILEAATVECKKRSIDTPEVNEALNTLALWCRPDCIEAFRHCLRPCEDWHGGLQTEGQQQNLRVDFAVIYRDVRSLLVWQIGRLGTRYIRTKDAAVKTEIARLKAELEKLPRQWDFNPNRTML